MGKEDLDLLFDIDDDFDDLLDNIETVKEELPNNKLKKSLDKTSELMVDSKEVYEDAKLILQEKQELSSEIKTDYEKAKDTYREYMQDLCTNMKVIYDKSLKVVNRIDEELDDGPLNNKMVEAFAKLVDAINKLFDNVRATNDDIIRFEERRAIDTGEISPMGDLMQGGAANIQVNNTQIGNVNMTSSEMLSKFMELKETAEEQAAEELAASEKIDVEAEIIEDEE